MGRSRLRIATLVFLVAAGIALVAFGIGQFSTLRALWAEAAGYDWDPGPVWLAAALALGVLALAGTARAWASLFARTGGRTGVREGMAAWLGSNLGRYLPGKIWQLTGLAAYLRARGDSGGAGIATSLALQAITLLTGIAFGAAIAGSTLSAALGRWRLILLIALLLLFTQPATIRWLSRVGGRILREPQAGAVRVPARALGESALWIVVLWAVTGIGFWSLVRGLIGAAAPSLVIATGIYATAYVIGFLVLIAPGGLIVRESVMTGLLVALGGTPVSVAALVAVIARIWMTLAELVAFGLIAMAGGPVLERASARGDMTGDRGGGGNGNEAGSGA